MYNSFSIKFTQKVIFDNFSTYEVLHGQRRYVAMVSHLVVVGQRLFTIATYRRGFELCLLFGRERQHFDIVRHNPIYNVQFIKNVLIEYVHHVVGPAVQCRRGLIFGVCRDTVTAESVNRADPAATRVDVIFLVVGGIRWSEKGFEIAD